jgi:hypothetical protein
MPFYHATTLDRIESIQKHGLGGLAAAGQMFPGCESGVYLAAEALFALGFLIEKYIEGGFGRGSPAEMLKLFVVIVVDDARIDRTRLRQDPNIAMAGFWIYDGVVDVNAMPVVSADAVYDALLADGSRS